MPSRRFLMQPPRPEIATPRCLLSITTIGRAIAVGVSLLPFVAQSAALDSQFRAPTFTSQSEAQHVVVLPGDSFLVFGGFNQLNVAGTEGLVKFKPDGARDSGFQFAAGYVEVTAVAAMPDARLIVAARREEKSGRKSYKILRLNSNGSIDSAFDAGSGADDLVRSIVIQGDGKILAGGFFNTFSSTSRPYLVRLQPDGAIDASLKRWRYRPSIRFIGQVSRRISPCRQTEKF